MVKKEGTRVLQYERNGKVEEVVDFGKIDKGDQAVGNEDKRVGLQKHHVRTSCESDSVVWMDDIVVGRVVWFVAMIDIMSKMVVKIEIRLTSVQMQDTKRN